MPSEAPVTRAQDLRGPKVESWIWNFSWLEMEIHSWGGSRSWFDIAGKVGDREAWEEETYGCSWKHEEAEKKPDEAQELGGYDK